MRSSSTLSEVWARRAALVKCAAYALTLLLVSSTVFSQASSKSYDETRKLLLKLDRSNYKNGALPKLFRNADRLRDDLERALYDNDQKVSLNAQVIIKYLDDPALLAIFDKWVESRKASPGTYWLAPIQVLKESKYLDGKYGDLPDRVIKTLYEKAPDLWAREIGRNERLNTILIEVVQGSVFTEGWHVVVRKENERWKVLSKSLVWQS